MLRYILATCFLVTAVAHPNYWRGVENEESRLKHQVAQALTNTVPFTAGMSPLFAGNHVRLSASAGDIGIVQSSSKDSKMRQLAGIESSGVRFAFGGPASAALLAELRRQVPKYPNCTRLIAELERRDTHAAVQNINLSGKVTFFATPAACGCFIQPIMGSRHKDGKVTIHHMSFLKYDREIWHDCSVEFDIDTTVCMALKLQCIPPMHAITAGFVPDTREFLTLPSIERLLSDEEARGIQVKMT